MNPHNYTLPAAIALLMLTTAPVLTSCANTKQMSPQAEAAALKIKEAAQSHATGGACGVFIKQLRELYQNAGKECSGDLRQAMAKRGGV